MAQFTVIHSSEGIRHRHVKSSLARVLGQSVISVMNSDRTSPDFVTLDSSDELPVYLLIGEEKGEFGDGGSDPSVQATFSYQRLFSQEEVITSILSSFSFFADIMPRLHRILNYVTSVAAQLSSSPMLDHG